MLARISAASVGLMCFGREGCLTPESTVREGDSPLFWKRRRVELFWTGGNGIPSVRQRPQAWSGPEVILSMDELNLDQALQDINKEEFQLERVRLQAFVAATNPGCKKELMWSGSLG
ncbi:hypothetical protein TNCV_4367741 [Trichonephila clavipes]|nr:hypothetical protein TNCV_4367741 [Trichonephila clavipes]